MLLPIRIVYNKVEGFLIVKNLLRKFVNWVTSTQSSFTLANFSCETRCVIIDLAYSTYQKCNIQTKSVNWKQLNREDLNHTREQAPVSMVTRMSQTLKGYVCVSPRLPSGMQNLNWGWRFSFSKLFDSYTDQFLTIQIKRLKHFFPYGPKD